MAFCEYGNERSGFINLGCISCNACALSACALSACASQKHNCLPAACSPPCDLLTARCLRQWHRASDTCSPKQFARKAQYSSTSLYGASLIRRFSIIFIFIIFGACLAFTAVTRTSAEFVRIIFTCTSSIAHVVRLLYALACEKKHVIRFTAIFALQRWSGT